MFPKYGGRGDYRFYAFLAAKKKNYISLLLNVTERTWKVLVNTVMGLRKVSKKKQSYPCNRPWRPVL
jgi:hypothetical protein